MTAPDSTFGPTILHRAISDTNEYCESCGAGIPRGVARFSFDIGGGDACVCHSCCHKMTETGLAILQASAPGHAAFAEAFPPREGYKCSAKPDTYGGGCFNCGWNTARDARRSGGAK